MSMKQGNKTSRGLALAQTAVGSDAGITGRIFGAALADAAAGDMRSDQRLDGEAGALVHRQCAALKTRDSGLIQPKLLAHFDLRQAKLAPNVSEIVHGNG